MDKFDESSNTISMFNTLRSYIEHENELVNNRMTWFTSLNSFLFAATALVISPGQFGSSKEISTVSSMGFIGLLAIVGLFSSGTTFISVRAAFRTMRSVRDLWMAKYERDAKPTPAEVNAPTKWRHDTSKMLPFMVGGGPRAGNSAMGSFSSFALIVAMGTVWLVILLYVLLYGATGL